MKQYWVRFYVELQMRFYLFVYVNVQGIPKTGFISKCV